MPQSLRKACHACTQAKRRCIPQLPSCERCAKKRILCIYDLEPVSQDLGQPQAQPMVETLPPSTESNHLQNQPDGELKLIYDSVSAAKDASVAAVGRGEGANSTAARPMLMANDELARWLIDFFTQVAKDGLDGKASPFIHPVVLRDTIISPVSNSSLPHRRPSSDLSSPTLSSPDQEALSDHLNEVHSLTILALQRLLLEKPRKKQDVEVENIVTRMFSSTQSLWHSAPDQLRDLPSDWECWAMAESVRRSMFAAVMIRGLWYATANGYCYYEPFFESLPFDPRAGVWEATSQQEWTAILNLRGGGHTTLKSYNEFITTTGQNLSCEEDGIFQRMLFVAYHGSSGIRALEEFLNTERRRRSSNNEISQRARFS